MYNLTTFDHLKVHFVGVGGVSMSGLALILSSKGSIVSGSDKSDSPVLRKLNKSGIKTFIGHDEANVHDRLDLLVYSAAISLDNPELVKANELSIPCIERAELLGLVMKDYEIPIAISGTHGKTTTTGMITEVLLDAELDPTITIGGDLPSIRGNVRLGESDYFVTEACEYHRSFLHFFPRFSIILNVEEDHLDYYKDIEDIKSAFRDFADLTPENGCVVVNGDDQNIASAISDCEKNIIRVGFGDSCDYVAKYPVKNENQYYSFSIFKNGENIDRVLLSVPGYHNILNALAVFAVCDQMGISHGSIVRGLSRFRGVNRRFEKKGTFNDILVVDDYAHHPTEISTTLKIAKSMTNGKVWCVFQPHTYTRTKALFDDFVTTFNDSNVEVLMLNIYAAREKDTGIISARELSDAINNSTYVETPERAISYIKRYAEPGDIVLTVGAGDVYKVGEMLLKD